MTAVAIRGTTYPVVFPKLRDPRLHLAATITSLQVLGQVAFNFRLSISQILVALGTCAVLEIAITFRTKRVIMWPASALLTANGVAFVLRIPGMPHGAWWSFRDWWLYAAVAGGSLLSKHVIKWKGEHVFNPSNIGLVACFLILGRGRAEPLDFWWGPMSWWMALALAIIVTGGFTILRRLHLLRVALAFWASFALGIGVIAIAGHQMTARWHLGPISGWNLWCMCRGVRSCSQQQQRCARTSPLSSRRATAPVRSRRRSRWPPAPFRRSRSCRRKACRRSSTFARPT